jgi:uncharacterized membrane protein YdjX (TVP38/TMEM64 family)
MAKGSRKWRVLGKWLGVAVVAIGIFVAWRLLPVKDWLKVFGDRVSDLGPMGAVLFGAVYVVAALLLVPGAILTVGAGLLFGLLWGTVVVSLASTAAAALAFLIARYFARQRVEILARKNEKFEAIDRAIGQNGWKVVGLLRLSPLIPFSISNYLYGLTAVDFLPYVAASWVGMLPGTILYVYLGAVGGNLREGREKNPWEWALLGAGLLATAAVTLIVTRVARRELEKQRVVKKGS